MSFSKESEKLLRNLFAFSIKRTAFAMIEGLSFVKAIFIFKTSNELARINKWS